MVWEALVCRRSGKLVLWAGVADGTAARQGAAGGQVVPFQVANSAKQHESGWVVASPRHMLSRAGCLPFLPSVPCRTCVEPA